VWPECYSPVTSTGVSAGCGLLRGARGERAEPGTRW
jgi:hypothetical protein